MTESALSCSKEALATNGQIVVFGSRISGVYDTANSLEEVLKANGYHVDVQAVRDASLIGEVFDTYEETLRGVVLLPEMRQYDPESGRDMTLMTYECGIEEYVEVLCSELGVPLAKLRNPSQKQVTEEIKKLSSGS